MNLCTIIATISILTWNTGRMGEFKKPDKNEVLQFLMTQDADIVCLQEVDVYKDAKFLTLPEVKQVLGRKYAYSYLDFSVYNSRHQYGTMVWSKYPLIHKQSIRYETQGNLSNRCDVVVGRDTFRLFNNHLESYKLQTEDLQDVNKIEQKWKRAIPLRNKQAQTVRAEIDASPYPVIVVGDFNSPVLSYAYWCLTGGLHDAWSYTHAWGDNGSTYSYKGFGLRIDYILCSDPLRPVRCEVPKTTGSDHKPVVATLEW